MPGRAKLIATIATAAVVAGLALSATPTTAWAASYEELSARVAEATSAYDEAMSRVSQAQDEIEKTEGEIAQLEEQEIPAQRERAAESLRTLYKMHQSSGGLVELMLSADNFNDFVATIVYLDRIQAKNLSELRELAELNAKLLEAKDVLSARKAQASQEAEAAYQAQQDAIAARDEVVRQALAQAAAEQAEAEAALAAAKKDAEEGKTFTNASGQEVPVSAADTAPSPADTQEDAQDLQEEDKAADEKEAPAEGDAEQEESQADASQAEEEPQEEETQKQQEAQEQEEAQKQEEAQEQQAQEEESTPVVSERDAFVAKWAPRIDAYLAGYPLGGHGTTFAEAAWDYGVDPRWSPAISCIESTKGLQCFKSHNAWGWGSSSWSDWDSAIRDHVAGLASGYGYTISPSAAQKYCPPTWQAWYSSVSAEMAKI